MNQNTFFLKQLGFAVDHLPPTIPEDKQKDIQAIYKELVDLGEGVDQSSIQEAMIRIGKIEWPYRHAYEAMVDVCCSHTQHDILLKLLSDKTRKKFEEIGGADATVQEVVHSKLFEEALSPEQRYEVQEAALESRLKMFDYMEGMIKQRNDEYQDLLKKSFAEAEQIEEALKKLEALIPIDEHWGPEIEGKVQQYRLGWSIAEPDVSLDAVNKEIEYWQGTLSASEQGAIDDENY